MSLLLHGVPIAAPYLIYDGDEYVPVSAVNARDAYLTARGLATPVRAMAAEQPCLPIPLRVYQLDPQGELIAVYE